MAVQRVSIQLSSRTNPRLFGAIGPPVAVENRKRETG